MVPNIETLEKLIKRRKVKEFDKILTICLRLGKE